MYNKVIMVGNLTRDIELKYLPSGSAIAKSAIATSHKYKMQTGEQKEEVCFLDFTVFGKGAEVLNQYVRKGSKVLLEGRLVLEQWQDQNGQNRSKHSLRVEEFKFLDSKADSMNMQNGGGYNHPIPQPAQQPMATQQQYGQPVQNTQVQQAAPSYDQSGYPQNNSYQQNAVPQQNSGMNSQNSYEQNIPTIDIDDDEIPF